MNLDVPVTGPDPIIQIRRQCLSESLTAAGVVVKPYELLAIDTLTGRSAVLKLVERRRPSWKHSLSLYVDVIVRDFEARLAANPL